MSSKGNGADGKTDLANGKGLPESLLLPPGKVEAWSFLEGRKAFLRVDLSCVVLCVGNKGVVGRHGTPFVMRGLLHGSL